MPFLGKTSSALRVSVAIFMASPKVAKNQIYVSNDTDTLRESDVRAGFDHRVGHWWPRSMTAESSPASFLRC
jgi:hypothetical protein